MGAFSLCCCVTDCLFSSRLHINANKTIQNVVISNSCSCYCDTNILDKYTYFTLCLVSIETFVSLAYGGRMKCLQSILNDQHYTVGAKHSEVPHFPCWWVPGTVYVQWTKLETLDAAEHLKWPHSGYWSLGVRIILPSWYPKPRPWYSVLEVGRRLLKERWSEMVHHSRVGPGVTAQISSPRPTRHTCTLKNKKNFGTPCTPPKMHQSPPNHTATLAAP